MKSETGFQHELLHHVLSRRDVDKDVVILDDDETDDGLQSASKLAPSSAPPGQCCVFFCFLRTLSTAVQH